MADAYWLGTIWYINLVSINHSSCRCWLIATIKFPTHESYNIYQSHIDHTIEGEMMYSSANKIYFHSFNPKYYHTCIWHAPHVQYSEKPVFHIIDMKSMGNPAMCKKTNKKNDSSTKWFLYCMHICFNEEGLGYCYYSPVRYNKVHYEMILSTTLWYLTI